MGTKKKKLKEDVYMLKKALLGIAAVIAVLAIAVSAQADGHKPGDGVTVQPARATWNTGFFQEALVRRGLGRAWLRCQEAQGSAEPDIL